MQAPDPSPDLENELEAFRREWQATLRHQQQHTSSSDSASTSALAVTAAPSVPIRMVPSRVMPVPHPPPELAEEFEGLSIQDRQKASRAAAASSPPKKAVDLYRSAVDAEKEGRLSDALHFYRQSFRMDPDVDKAYHRSMTAPTALARSPPRADDSTEKFRFERTLQMAPDYAPEREQRSAQAVREVMGRGEAQDEEHQHPSSTKFLLTSLFKSFEQHPFIPLSERAAPLEGEISRSHAMEPAPFNVTFIKANEEEPLPLTTLPHEVLMLVLRAVLFSSVTPPPKVKAVVDGAEAPVTKKNKPRLSTKQEREMLELELGLEVVERHRWQTDVEALERFGRTCRAARILTLDEGLWRDLVARTYIPPHQISREEDAYQITNEQHAGDWRRCFIEHPRVRMDGCYIAVVTYLRRGDNAHAWYAPAHTITFYRFLRFYPSGLVLSYLTTDPPSEVVRKLNPSLKIKGLTRGRWRLRGEMLEAWGLEDSGIKEAQRKYSFRMTCRLRSTARGRMNKLEMVALATEHRVTQELEDVPIKPTKPFFFSKVASYAALDE